MPISFNIGSKMGIRRDELLNNSMSYDLIRVILQGYLCFLNSFMSSVALISISRVRQLRKTHYRREFSEINFAVLLILAGVAIW